MRATKAGVPKTLIREGDIPEGQHSELFEKTMLAFFDAPAPDDFKFMAEIIVHHF